MRVINKTGNYEDASSGKGATVGMPQQTHTLLYSKDFLFLLDYPIKLKKYIKEKRKKWCVEM